MPNRNLDALRLAGAGLVFTVTLALGFPALASPAQQRGTSTQSAPADSTSSSLMEQLQRQDAAFFEEELLQVNTAFRDSILTRHDDEGWEAFESRMRRRGRTMRPSIGLASHLVSYNRVDGAVPGLSAGLRSSRGTQIFGEIGYASGPRKLRHYEEIGVPVLGRKWRADLRLHYGERVTAYGSNEPVLNGLRFLVGGADDRDYLLREGGGVNLQWQHDAGLGFRFAYEATDEQSIAARTDFSFFGDPANFNAPIDEGIDRALSARLFYDSPDRRLQFSVSERVAGNGLGGRFAYNRVDATASARRYLVGRHEVVAQFAFARTGGSPPMQRLADVGGLSTVRGFPRRALVGETSLAGRLEYPVPWDLFGRARVPILGSLGLQLVPWVDAGRVWDGNSDTWIHSAGVGIQRFLGPFGSAANLRLDLAIPLGPDGTDDVRILLRFAPGLQ